MRKIRASVDLGTNTCLLLIAEWDTDSRSVTRIVSDHSTIVHLGQGVDKNRRFDPTAMDRALACLRDYARISTSTGANPEDAICVATSQARDSANSAEFFARVEMETGFKFRVISGDQEAELTFEGALLPGMSANGTVVIDIGGGSTELITRTAAGLSGQSLDVGSVRYTERYLKSDPVTDDEFWACQEAIDDELSRLIPWRERATVSPGRPALLGVAGTVTTLAQWHLEMPKFDAARIDLCVLHRGDVHRMVEELKWRTVEERKQLPGIEPGRAEVMLAGALILWRAMETLGFPECRVSTRGLRFGALRL